MAGRLSNQFTYVRLRDVDLHIGQAHVLRGLSLQLQHGELVGLMGESGSGKTTLLNVLSGRASYARVSGELSLNGRPFKAKDMQAMIGYVPQAHILFKELTVYENLSYAAELRLHRPASAAQREMLIEMAIDLLGLQDCRHFVCDPTIGERLSGGQMRRVCIGMELVCDPPIMILDEPTSALDSVNTRLVVASLKGLAQRGVLVIASLHQPRHAVYQMLDRLLLLRSGSLIYGGLRSEAERYFTGLLGYTLPRQANPADFLVEVAFGFEASATSLSDLQVPVQAARIQGSDVNFTGSHGSQERSHTSVSATLSTSTEAAAPLALGDAVASTHLALEAAIRSHPATPELAALCSRLPAVPQAYCQMALASAQDHTGRALALLLTPTVHLRGKAEWVAFIEDSRKAAKAGIGRREQAFVLTAGDWSPAALSHPLFPRRLFIEALTEAKARWEAQCSLYAAIAPLRGRFISERRFVHWAPEMLREAAADNAMQCQASVPPKRFVKPTDLGSLWRQWYASSQSYGEAIMMGLQNRQSEGRRRAKVILHLAKILSGKAGLLNRALSHHSRSPSTGLLSQQLSSSASRSLLLRRRRRGCSQETPPESRARARASGSENAAPAGTTSSDCLPSTPAPRTAAPRSTISERINMGSPTLFFKMITSRLQVRRVARSTLKPTHPHVMMNSWLPFTPGKPLLVTRSMATTREVQIEMDRNRAESVLPSCTDVNTPAVAQRGAQHIIEMQDAERVNLGTEGEDGRARAVSSTPTADASSSSGLADITPCAPPRGTPCSPRVASTPRANWNTPKMIPRALSRLRDSFSSRPSRRRYRIPHDMLRSLDVGVGLEQFKTWFHADTGFGPSLGSMVREELAEVVWQIAAAAAVESHTKRAKVTPFLGSRQAHQSIRQDTLQSRRTSWWGHLQSTPRRFVSTPWSRSATLCGNAAPNAHRHPQDYELCPTWTQLRVAMYTWEPPRKRALGWLTTFHVCLRRYCRKLLRKRREAYLLLALTYALGALCGSLHGSKPRSPDILIFYIFFNCMIGSVAATSTIASLGGGSEDSLALFLHEASSGISQSAEGLARLLVDLIWPIFILPVAFALPLKGTCTLPVPLQSLIIDWWLVAFALSPLGYFFHLAAPRNAIVLTSSVSLIFCAFLTGFFGLRVSDLSPTTAIALAWLSPGATSFFRLSFGALEHMPFGSTRLSLTRQLKTSSLVAAIMGTSALGPEGEQYALGVTRDEERGYWVQFELGLVGWRWRTAYQLLIFGTVLRAIVVFLFVMRNHALFARADTQLTVWRATTTMRPRREFGIHMTCLRATQAWM